MDRFIHFRCLASRTLTGLPCSQGTPRACAVLSDPGRTSAPRHNGTPVLPPPLGQRRLQPHLYFEAPSHGFGTGCLRFVPPLLTTTQNSLPGVANLFRVGLDTHGVPLESFGPSGPPLSLGFPWRDQALKPLAPSGLPRFWHPGCLHVQCCATLRNAVQRFQAFAKHLAPRERLKGEGLSGLATQPCRCARLT